MVGLIGRFDNAILPFDFTAQVERYVGLNT